MLYFPFRAVTPSTLTGFILQYLSEPELRRRIRRGLLKVEQLHALARDVFYGRRGRINARELWEQMNTCSCLNLILACIVYWQARESPGSSASATRSPMDSAQGKLIASLMAALAEFERDLLRERIRSGIAAARKRGVVFGRRPGQRVKADRYAPRVLKLVGEGQSYREISHRLGLRKDRSLKISVEVLNAIYEEDFLGFSYGFRPGRGQHDALDALAVGITRTKVNWIVDADITGFFDAVSHEWLMRFVEDRIGDRRINRLFTLCRSPGALTCFKFRFAASISSDTSIWEKRETLDFLGVDNNRPPPCRSW